MGSTTRLSTSLAEAPGYTTITNCMGIFMSCISSMGIPSSEATPNTTIAKITKRVETGRFNTNFVIPVSPGLSPVPMRRNPLFLRLPPARER